MFTWPLFLQHSRDRGEINEDKSSLQQPRETHLRPQWSSLIISIALAFICIFKSNIPVIVMSVRYCFAENAVSGFFLKNSIAIKECKENVFSSKCLTFIYNICNTYYVWYSFVHCFNSLSRYKLLKYILMSDGFDMTDDFFLVFL